jgi:tetratricopeptide (TPR) repeat protein
MRNGMAVPLILRPILFLLVLFPARSTAPQSANQNPQTEKTSSQNLLEAYLGQGYEALKEEKYEEAEKDFRAALTLDPSLEMRARFPLGIALFDQQRFADSRREFVAVQHAVGDQPGIFYYLGRIDLEERDYKSAVANLKKASLHPPFPDTAFYLGLAYLKQGSYQEAEKWLNEAIQSNPKDSQAQYMLATLYRKEGRQQEANQAFERLKQKKDLSDRRSQLKWECAQELDRGPDEKPNSCELLYDPNDAETLTELGILYGQHGQLEMALKPLQRAAELTPQSAQIQYNLAFTYFQLKRFEEARGTLAVSVQRWPDLFPLNALYGAVLWNLDESIPAYQALRHAHQLNAQDPGTTELLHQATLALAKRSESADAESEALRYLQEAASLVPTDPEPHRRMASIYRRTGRSGQAITEEQKAEEIIKSAKE